MQDQRNLVFDKAHTQGESSMEYQIGTSLSFTLSLSKEKWTVIY